MTLVTWQDPALTVALALAAGILAVSLARHVGLPSIVLLLAAGVMFGPEGLGILHPATLGDALHALIGFAVSVILFEGAMNLNIRRLRREARTIRALVTVGALISATGGALAARMVLEWSWQTSILFGALVIVTGPTVITPLLRRINVTPSIDTVLSAEGVFLDAIGAIVAVVALEITISQSHAVVASGLTAVAVPLGVGTVAGLLVGLALAGLLRVRTAVPDGLENIFTLCAVFALFHLSNAVIPESGIVSVTVAGLVVGNVRTRVRQELLEFKEQLTVMLIGMLFVLLAADVGLSEIFALGIPGIVTVLILMLIVRPVNVVVCTYGSSLSWREKAFISWLAPRGIVAAAIASLFARRLTAAGVPGGQELEALVFMVIGITVLVQGLSGTWLAGLLGVRRAINDGYVILGANPLGLALGRALRDADEPVLFIDGNPDATQAAESEGFRVLYGNGLEERTMQRAEMSTRRGCIGVTPNEGVNLLFARTAREDFKVPSAYVALGRGHAGVQERMVQDSDAQVLFGGKVDFTTWVHDVAQGNADIALWTRIREDAALIGGDDETPVSSNMLIPLIITHGAQSIPVTCATEARRHDVVRFLVNQEHADEARAWLTEHGWAQNTSDMSDAAPVKTPA